LQLKHHLHSTYDEKNNIERNIQFIKDGTEFFDDYFPFAKNIKKKCKLIDVVNWFNLLV
jgi:hypothetical protein